MKSDFDPRKEYFAYFTFYWTPVVHGRGLLFSTAGAIMKSTRAETRAAAPAAGEAAAFPDVEVQVD